MNYFDPYPLQPDENIVAAWDSQVAKAESPWLAQVLAQADSELLPRFAASYSELRALPRSARRALQRQIARSSELATALPEWFRRGNERALQYKLARSLAGAALLLALGQGIVEAATITVTTNNPNIRRGDKKCSLIEAIVNANADAQVYPNCPAGSGADTIVLPANADFVLNSLNNKTYGPTGLPVITSPITIQGNGAKIVRRNNKLLNKRRPFRLIAVSNTGELALQDVTLSGGSALADDNGGAILNHGTLSIENSTISGNTAPQGGEGGGVFSGGTLTIANSTVFGNSGGLGGGVFNAGTFSVGNSTISGNHAVWSGGGISNFGAVEVASSTISDNSAGLGGGVYNGSSWSSPNTLNITNSTISGNVASDDGGGIFNHGSGCIYWYSCYSGGDLSLADSTITQNQAGDSGGGLYNGGTLSVTNSTISNNQATLGPDTFP